MIFKEETFKLFFGPNEFSIEEPEEVQQLLAASLDQKAFAAIAAPLLKKAHEKYGSFNKFLETPDK
jgi:hypothetical protein